MRCVMETKDEEVGGMETVGPTSDARKRWVIGELL